MKKQLVALAAALALTLAPAGCARDAESAPAATAESVTTTTTVPDEPLSPLIGDVILSGEEVRQIREDYWEWITAKYPDIKEEKTLDAVVILKSNYVGTFDDAIALRIAFDYGDMVTECKVAGYTLYLPNDAPVYIYKNREFKELPEAYESGWIGKDAVRQMAEYYADWE